MLLSASKEKVKGDIVQYINICSVKMDGAEKWNKPIN